MADQAFSIAGQNTLIVGGTAGIGLGVAEHFVAAGARVVISGRRASGGEIAAGIGSEFVPLDLADEQSITTGIKLAAELLEGSFDTLVLNAGIIGAAGTADNLDLDVFRRVFDINLFGIAQALRDALGFMGPGGSVIVTSSPASNMLMPGGSAYSASKAAVDTLVKTSALELAERNIRINAVLPGVVETEMALDEGSLDEELEMLSSLTATGKVREPADMGPPFQFLASKASQTCTGTLLYCEDGASAGYSKHLLEKAFGD